MKTNFTFSKLIRNSITVFFLGLVLIAAGCYTITYIIQPGVVEPESAFDVKIRVDLSGGYEPGDYVPAYGMLGILLPEGWTVKDSPEYCRITGNNSKKGFFRYNSTVVSFLNSSAGQPPDGYYWWGAKSLDLIDLALLDSGFINVTILTDDKVGQFQTKYMLGDDNFWYKKNEQDSFGIVYPGDFLPIQVKDNVSHAADSWKNEEWDIYPNPSNGQLFIQQPGLSGEVMMSVYDLNGKLQKSDILRESLNRIDLSTFSKGTYIVSLEKRGEIKTKKLIIQ